MMSVTFSFDPSCPWTWRTSRWLTQVAEVHDIEITWRPLSLHVLNEDKDIPERHRRAAMQSFRALRLVAALRDAGRHEAVGRFYAELGRRVHEDGTPIGPEVIEAAAVAAGLADDLGALDDSRWDDVLRDNTQAAVSSAGPDVGSPVLELAGAPRGIHGPILSQLPEQDEAVTLWDSVATLLRSGAFLEVKRGRPARRS